MRPRITITRLIVAVFLAATLLLGIFILLAHPTNRAQSFLNEFNTGARFPYSFLQLPTVSSAAPSNPVIQARTTKLLPQTWRDLFNLQRRIAIETTWTDQANPDFHARDEVEIYVSFNSYVLTGERYTQ